jgi:hypothetical protein
MKKKRPAVDPASYDLAEHFLGEVPGATEDDIWSLADDIQKICEAYEIRRKAAEKDSQGQAK